MKNRMLTKLAAISMTAAMSFGVFTAIPGGVVLADGTIPDGISIEGTKATLTDDVTIEYPIPDVDITELELNGFTLTYNQTSIPLFNLDGVNLEIKDSSELQLGKIITAGAIIVNTSYDEHSETVTLSGGTLVGPASETDKVGNSAIKIYSNDSFVMNGGTITNFFYDKGGAIRADGYGSFVTINAGTIENCFATYGGAIYAENSQSVSMNGGTIRYCSAERGGGIYSKNADVGINALSNIIYNSATVQGGGICHIDERLDEQCSLFLNGGFIQNNSCASFEGQAQGGGGVYVEVKYPNPEGCMVIVDCTIQNNSNSTGTKKNLYLAKADNKTFFDGKGITKVGISRYGAEAEQELATVRYKGYSSHNNLESDNPGFDFQLQVSEGEYSNDKLLFVEIEVVENCEVKGCNLVLDGSSIGIKYTVFIPDSYTSEQIANLRAQGTFKWNADTTKRGIGIANTDVEPISTTRDANGCIEFLIKVYSTDMSVNVRFALTDKPVGSGGQEIFSNTDFSVAGYAETLLASPSEYNLGTKEIGIITAMLNYGAASQKKFGVCTDNLANDCIKGTDHHDEYVEPTNVEARTLTQSDTEHIKFYAASIVFDGAVSLKLYFKYADIDPKTDVVITVDGTKYTAYTTTNSDGISPYCYIKINGIEPKNIDHQYNVVVTEGADEVIDLSYSPLNYIDGVFKKNSTDEMGTLVKALYTYYKTLNVGNQ